MKLYQLLNGISFKLLSGDLGIEVLRLEDNSQKVQKGDLFFAIKGTKMDGENYVAEAIEKGAVAVMTQSETLVACDPQATYIYVSDVRKTVGEIAKNFYCPNGYNFKIIGITGTNGKTTTSFMIGDALSQNKFNTCVVGTSGVFVNGRQLRGEHLTTPDPIELQSLFAFLNSIYIDYVVMEVSAHALDLDKTAGVEFDYAIFTNLTEDHLDYFNNMEAYGASKKKLFENKKFKFGIINNSDKFGNYLFQSSIPSKIKTYGEGNSDYKIIKLSNNSFKLKHNNTSAKIKMNISGLYNFYNATASIILLLNEGISERFIKRYFKKLKVVEGRYNEFKVDKHGKIILDFAHTPDGLQKILTNVRENMRGRGKLISVFGCGGNRDEKKRPMMGEISAKLADFTIISIDNPRFEDPTLVMGDIEKGVKSVTNKYEIVMPRSLAIKKAIMMSEEDDCIVISGKGTEPYYEVNGRKEFYREDIVIDCIKRKVEQ